MKTFLQYITEAGIRRKQRVAAAKERASWDANILNLEISPNERQAARREWVAAEADVRQEQLRRVPRIVRRAKAEAEAHVPAFQTPEARIERMADVGTTAAEWGKEMLRVQKPGFVPGYD